LQLAQLVLPTELARVSTAHAAHTVSPPVAENLPVGQGVHCASATVVASGCVKKPAKHVLAPLHAVSPATSVYLPAAQPRQ